MEFASSTLVIHILLEYFY